MRKLVAGWSAAALTAFLFLPWQAIEDGFFGFGWVRDYPDDRSASALFYALAFDRPWLWGVLPFVALGGVALAFPREDRRFGQLLIAAGLGGIGYTFLQGFAIGITGLQWTWLAPLIGQIETSQYGFGWGATIVLFAFLMMTSLGVAALGYFRGDAFIAGSVIVSTALILAFVFFPIATMLAGAVTDEHGNLAFDLFWRRFFADDIWELNCLVGGPRCGVVFNTVLLGVLTGALSTLMGLAFALVVVRTGLPWRKGLRALTILPIITPPFVISLAIIVLFGRTGIVTWFLEVAFGIPPSRWIYGLPGVLISQLLSQIPVAFLVMIGVVEAISPSLEEASQTLGASRWQTFRTVTWPLLRPGLAAAFLLGFVESLADFGNPLVLGGNFDVLSTKIFFAIVGAQHDPGRAAVLAILLLIMTLGAFWIQMRWLGRQSYVTVTGKGDSGLSAELPRTLKRVLYWTTIPWAAFTLITYAIVIFGGFVRDIGRFDLEFTWRHYLDAFRVELTERGMFFSGSAWDSLMTTIEVSAISAPLTGIMGLLVAYILARTKFAGQRTFEFLTMLSFAIPGTVVGVSYIVAFNVPPLELTGTGLILVICFVFRNMPVGVRAGMAALSQIDKSLDEASLTLGARTATTVRRVVMPLLRPAIVATLVFSFVHAMTAVSAVIFLVSARHNMATAYIVGRVEAGEFALAIAYSTVLIGVMALAIVIIQLGVGRRQLGRRGQQTAAALGGH
ncbi:MAG: iron ABC transporter permease [Tagaea sp. CACIAM 22H2]|nr:iron ABC transporter permease [Tagaea sp. CACIAM 22H2]